MMAIRAADARGLGMSAIPATAPTAEPTTGPSPRPVLIVTRGNQLGQHMPISASPTRIGRHRNCEVSLDDTSVSIFHAEVRQTAEHQYLLIDTGSLTGTEVNREQVTCRALDHGDEIRVGKVRLVFDEEQSDTAPISSTAGPTPPEPRSP